MLERCFEAYDEAVHLLVNTPNLSTSQKWDLLRIIKAALIGINTDNDRRRLECLQRAKCFLKTYNVTYNGGT